MTVEEKELKEIDYLIRLDTNNNDYIYRFKAKTQEELFNLALDKFNKQKYSNDYIQNIDIRLVSDLPTELQNDPDLIGKLLLTLL